MAFYMMLRTMQNLICPAPEQINFQVIYEQRERVFHRVIQTRENNGEYTSASAFVHYFRVVHMASQMNRDVTSNQAYRNYTFLTKRIVIIALDLL